jgi:hypothetical protein
MSAAGEKRFDEERVGASELVDAGLPDPRGERLDIPSPEVRLGPLLLPRVGVHNVP